MADKIINLGQKKQERVTELATKRNELIERLDRGAARIQDARAEGKNVDAWEDYWISLLRTYEKVCDELAALGAYPTEGGAA